MSDALSPKPILESFAYALELEMQIALRGAGFEISVACAAASGIERLAQAFAADLDPQLGSLKLAMVAEAGASTLRLRPLLGGKELSQGMTAARVATALWASVLSLKARVEAAPLTAYPPALAGILQREFSAIEKLLQPGQAMEVACVIKESWEYMQGGRKRVRSDEWSVASGAIRQAGDAQPMEAEAGPLARSAQIPLRWPFRPLSFFGPGDPFTPWWEKRKP
jgi:hypothetical protein